jgi:predicted outer membrane repeat protein
MRKFLTSLAAISLIGSFFFMAPAPVAAADDSNINDAKVNKITNTNIVQVADALETTGKYQTYLVTSNATITYRFTFIGDNDSLNGIFSSFKLSLAGSGASFGAEWVDNIDEITSTTDCGIDWTDEGDNDQTATFRQGTIDCDNGSSMDQVHLDLPITVPTNGPAVLNVDYGTAGVDFKVYFMAQASGDSIYVGSNNMTTDGSGSCADPDFSTTDAAQGFDDQEAIDSALQSINQDTDEVVICDGNYGYTGSIREYKGWDLYSGTLTVRANEPGEVTLDGNDDYQLLNVSYVDLSVTGINFLDGDAYHGGAIYVENSDEVTEGVFVGGNLTVLDSNFTSNEARGDGIVDSDGSGGALYVEGSLTITNATFVNNEANIHGGAIYVYGNDYASDETSIDNTEFSDNDAYYGGAIAVYGSPMTVTNNSLFERNDAEHLGGAIFADGILTVEDSMFDDNYAVDYGGAIYADAISFVYDSIFTDNTVGGVDFGDDGGAIYADGPAEVYDSEFTGNQSYYDDGGAIYADSTLYVSDSTFADNYAAEYGGAITAEGDTEIDGSTFERNTTDDEGGAVFTYYDTDITNSTFVENESRDWGGALSSGEDGGVLTIDNSTLRGNISAKGGAIDSFNDRLILTRTRFLNNRATVYGGAIARSGRTYRGDISRTNVFRGNRARTASTVALYDLPVNIARRDAALWKIPGVTAYAIGARTPR